MFCTLAIVRFVLSTAFFTFSLRFALCRMMIVAVAGVTLPDVKLRCVYFCVVIFRVDEESEFDASVGGMRIMREYDD
jgi:hypothetical protein